MALQLRRPNGLRPLDCDFGNPVVEPPQRRHSGSASDGARTAREGRRTSLPAGPVPYSGSSAPDGTRKSSKTPRAPPLSQAGRHVLRGSHLHPDVDADARSSSPGQKLPHSARDHRDARHPSKSSARTSREDGGSSRRVSKESMSATAHGTDEDGIRNPPRLLQAFREGRWNSPHLVLPPVEDKRGCSRSPAASPRLTPAASPRLTAARSNEHVSSLAPSPSPEPCGSECDSQRSNTELSPGCSPSTSMMDADPGGYKQAWNPAAPKSRSAAFPWGFNKAARKAQEAMDDGDGDRSPARDSSPANSVASCEWIARQRVRKASKLLQRRRVERLEEGEKIFDLYEWSKVLQEDGDGGKVVVCSEKGWLEYEPRHVMKMKAKRSLTDSVESFKERLEMVMNIPPHENVVRIERVLEDDSLFYTLMWKANGGSLLEGLLLCHPSGVVPGETLVTVTRGILQGLEHIHACGILHRDIKPDNIVLEVLEGEDDDDPKACSRAMICDFDHAGQEGKANESGNLYGTRAFSAPETFRFASSKQSDVWSVGVVLYLIVSGKMPYDVALFEMPAGPVDIMLCRRLVRKLESRTVDWNSEPWMTRPMCRSFCQWLLEVDLDLRPRCAGTALQHQWLEPEI
eukprot:TRINITY_DN9193_c0_g1_i1.p1 TRINITY_DN9193_c0_g1~~TRINITY_DN9193_c0_g1_i1.p1  ORF type:complete len:630 (+),score=96.82 TRINITY_DN9193_c0_g1_i1:37-1926(+)